jgi:hypothetical protein
MNELIVKTEELKLPHIIWNNKEVAEAVSTVVTKYRGIEFTEEQLPDAKKDLAGLRKVKKNLNDEKIRIKKLWNENYTDFETDIKAFMADIDSVANNIAEQVKTFEDKVKDARREEIQAYPEWEEIKKYITFDDKWLLKKWESTDDKNLKELFTGFKNDIDQQIKVIKTTASSFGLDPTKYVGRIGHMEINDIIERMAEDRDLLEVTPVEERPAAEGEAVFPEVDINVDEPVLEFRRTIRGTKTQLSMLKAYADKIGVDIIK